MTDRPDIVIVGPGVVGTTLGVLAVGAGYRVVGVAGRSEGGMRTAARAIGPGVRVGTPEQIAPAGRLVLLTVPDDAIGPVCRRLAEAGSFADGAVVAHCSGALDSGILAPARDKCGAAIGSLHPLATFPAVEAALESFPGTYCFCEGDDRAVETLEALAEAIGGKPLALRAGVKLLYHASAVFASNYLAALIEAALTSAGQAGIERDDALQALGPLIRTTVENVLRLGPKRALTGPIARGDVHLVGRQFREVNEADGSLGELYRMLGLWTVELAVRKGSIDLAAAGRLRQALAGEVLPHRRGGGD